MATTEERPPAFDALIRWRCAIHMGTTDASGPLLYGSDQHILCAAVRAQCSRKTADSIGSIYEVGSNDTRCMISVAAPKPQNLTRESVNAPKQSTKTIK